MRPADFSTWLHWPLKAIHLHLRVCGCNLKLFHHLWLSLLRSTPFPGDLRSISSGLSLSWPWPRCRASHAVSLVLWVIPAAVRAPWTPPAAAVWCFPRWEGTRLGTGCGIGPLEELKPGCRDRGLGAGKLGCSASLGLSAETIEFGIHYLLCLDKAKHPKWCSEIFKEIKDP